MLEPPRPRIAEGKLPSGDKTGWKNEELNRVSGRAHSRSCHRRRRSRRPPGGPFGTIRFENPSFSPVTSRDCHARGECRCAGVVMKIFEPSNHPTRRRAAGRRGGRSRGGAPRPSVSPKAAGKILAGGEGVGKHCCFCSWSLKQQEMGIVPRARCVAADGDRDRTRSSRVSYSTAIE